MGGQHTKAKGDYSDCTTSKTKGDYADYTTSTDVIPYLNASSNTDSIQPRCTTSASSDQIHIHFPVQKTSSKEVLQTKSSTSTIEVAESSDLKELLSPKIRLQVLSPAHSRQQFRKGLDLDTKCSSLSFRPKQEVNATGDYFQPITQEVQASRKRITRTELSAQRTAVAFTRQIQQQLQSSAISDASQKQATPKAADHKTIKRLNATHTIVPLKGPAPTKGKLQITGNATSAPALSSVRKSPLRETAKYLETIPHLSAAASTTERKLKVRGLKNFIESHKRSCPPMWAKEFPCRSKYHPDTYLYDFEGIGAPKRPVHTMDRCPKKCGRCNRCGIYNETICSKCAMCPSDCKCSKNTYTDPSQFAPTAEYFISQVFGPGWAQSQKVEVNNLVPEPDRPRLNLHKASSNNPLRLNNSAEIAPSNEIPPALPTGYDTYTSVPTHDPTPAYHPPSYMPATYGYPYPYYPTSYPLPYSPYPSYMPSVAPVSPAFYPPYQTFQSGPYSMISR